MRKFKLLIPAIACIGLGLVGGAPSASSQMIFDNRVTPPTAARKVRFEPALHFKNCEVLRPTDVVRADYRVHRIVPVRGPGCPSHAMTGHPTQVVEDVVPLGNGWYQIIGGTSLNGVKFNVLQ